MDLEQIVKETVAKMVAEKKGKDLTGDGKIDSKDYLKARSMAIDKAKNLDEDYEVAMAQDSLDSIIRAAMMLKAQMGDKEINLPAWIQDHITNSENYIYQAAKGYHESSAQTNDEAGSEEMDEAQESNDDKIEKYEKYTYTLDGETVKPEIAFLNNILKAMLGNKIYNIGTPKDGKVELTPESGKKGTYTEAQDISDDELAQLQATADDTSKMPAERDAARNKIYASRAKKESLELDEWTISRWQHYAGIK